jgi:hypothetical protein
VTELFGTKVDIDRRVLKAIDRCASEGRFTKPVDCDLCPVRQECLAYWDEFIATEYKNEGSVSMHLKRLKQIRRKKHRYAPRKETVGRRLCRITARTLRSCPEQPRVPNDGHDGSTL